MKDPLKNYNDIALAQEHQTRAIASSITEGMTALEDIKKKHHQMRDAEHDFFEMAAQAEIMLNDLASHQEAGESLRLDMDIDALCAALADVGTETEQSVPMPHFARVETIDLGKDDEDFLRNVHAYAGQFKVDISRSAFMTVLSEQERAEVARQIEEEFTHKGARCDRYDYMIAGTCGLIGGLVDVFFVGMPAEGPLTTAADGIVDNAVEKIAKFLGWEGDNLKGSSGAIQFLEDRFKVNYDQQYGAAVGHLLGMSTRNHHIKSIGHWPDLVGLFFSILDQFCSTSHFLDNGRLITFDTSTGSLHGNNFVAKVFAGFVNWIGHLASDVAGSSSASGRGSGIPIPFYGLLLAAGFGSFGRDKKTLADIAVEVFEKGYDFRYGLTLCVPVAITEVLIRFMWAMKGRFYHKREWKQCIPSSSTPEVQRMLFIGHGTMCAVDMTDATLRSGGEMVCTLLRMNYVAWVRFGQLSVRELRAILRRGHLDDEKFDAHMREEYRRLLA